MQTIIEKAFEDRATINTQTVGDIRDAVTNTLAQLDAGTLRVAEKKGNEWVVHQWVKKAILLSFRLNPNEIIRGAPGHRTGEMCGWFDKVPMKQMGWEAEQFAATGFRAVPGSIVRHSAFIGKDVVLMPSFVNVGAYVGEGTMVDTWSTIGSCAQIGKHCHISGGVGIGGVLEPLQANPVIIEDNCFIGARSEVAEGVIVEEGSVISMGVYLGASTKIVDRATGEVMYGRVPAYSVVVAGNLPSKTPDAPSLYCAVIVKRVDEKTRSKTSINELLRA
jgi:2,3,4,5-tetrahydropyridine-2,6-dicarboxylate N-succinyltransferase